MYNLRETTVRLARKRAAEPVSDGSAKQERTPEIECKAKRAKTHVFVEFENRGVFFREKISETSTEDHSTTDSETNKDHSTTDSETNKFSDDSGNGSTITISHEKYNELERVKNEMESVSARYIQINNSMSETNEELLKLIKNLETKNEKLEKKVNVLEETNDGLAKEADKLKKELLKLKEK